MAQQWAVENKIIHLQVGTMILQAEYQLLNND
jgi:hypothetical protein